MQDINALFMKVTFWVSILIAQFSGRNEISVNVAMLNFQVQ